MSTTQATGWALVAVLAVMAPLLAALGIRADHAPPKSDSGLGLWAGFVVGVMVFLPLLGWAVYDIVRG